jgi:poly-gamma-glutamate synthase PgsB/CapB
MHAAIVVTAFLLGWLIYLVVERLRLDRHREAVPLRIAVTGTRGKTTVVRRLAAVLSQDGRRVLAKTTGSEAAYLFPDGSVQEIHRLGAPSIIEQKRLLRRGADLGVDVVLAEVMSLHPENHRVEVQEILRPHLVLLTNFRVDHVEAQGTTREEVASVLALDVPSGARVLVPEEEMEEVFRQRVMEEGAILEAVPAGAGRLPEGTLPRIGSRGFGPNLDLIWAAARHLGVEDEVIMEGLGHSQEDLGALKSWRYRHGPDHAPWLLVNAFAANDPESTLRIYDRISREEGIGPPDCVGLLSLRGDRGDRSLQWAEALEAGTLTRFRKLFVAGLHARAVKHRLDRGRRQDPPVEVLKPEAPAATMDRLLDGEGPEGGVLFGFGNIHGLGRTLVKHWGKVGEAHGT